MRLLTSTLMMLLISGCAIVDDPENVAAKKQFMPIEDPAYSRSVKHGVITVSEVLPRSDIIVMPPSVEHVVWLRQSQPAVVQTNDRQVGERARVKPESRPSTRRPVDTWPLLSEDMNFDSEIGRLSMCQRSGPCGPNEACAMLEPCEERENYDCFTTKQGDYCLEVIE